MFVPRAIVPVSYEYVADNGALSSWVESSCPCHLRALFSRLANRIWRLEAAARFVDSRGFGL